MINYIVILKGDRPEEGYILATRQMFETRDDAKHYADGVAQGREPLIVAGGFNEMRFAPPPRKRSPTSAAEIAKGPFGLGPKPETTRKRWMGSPPATCDVCNAPINGVFIDGSVGGGSWANMCETCHNAHGVGLGMGKGQKYEKGDQGFWWKTAGMLALVFGLSACGPQVEYTWTIPAGTTKADALRAYHQCRFEMVRAVPNTYSGLRDGDPISSAFGTHFAREEVFQACLDTHGYHKVRV